MIGVFLGVTFMALLNNSFNLLEIEPQWQKVVTGKERIITALQHGVPDRVPTFEWFIDPAIARSLDIPEDPISLVLHLDLDGINIRPDYQKHIIDESTFSDLSEG